jgi:hypothetical protein
MAFREFGVCRAFTAAVYCGMAGMAVALGCAVTSGAGADVANAVTAAGAVASASVAGLATLAAEWVRPDSSSAQRPPTLA